MTYTEIFELIIKSYQEKTGKTKNAAKADFSLLFGRSFDETQTLTAIDFADLICSLCQSLFEKDKQMIAKIVIGLPIFQKEEQGLYDFFLCHSRESLWLENRNTKWILVQLMYLYNEEQLDRAFIYSLTHEQKDIMLFVSNLKYLVYKLQAAGLLTADNLIYLRLLYLKTFEEHSEEERCMLSGNYSRKCQLFILLRQANLFENNKDSFEDPANGILSKDSSELTNFLANIPVYQLTQELWYGILECIRAHQPNPVNAIYTYIIQKLLDTFELDKFLAMQSFKPITGGELLEKLQNAYVDNQGKGLGTVRKIFGDSREITAAKKYLRDNQDIDFANNPAMVLTLINKLINKRLVIEMPGFVVKEPEFNATSNALKAILPFIIKDKSAKPLNKLVTFFEKYPKDEDFTRLIQKMSYLEEGCIGIGILEEAHIDLSDKIIQLITIYNSPTELAYAIRELYSANLWENNSSMLCVRLNIWNQLELDTNYHVFQTKYRIKQLVEIFRFLNKKNIPLTQERLEALLDPQNDYLLREGFQLLMQYCPAHYALTAANWDALVESCQGDDPGTTLMDCIVAIVGGAQTTHKPSVHAGVANSLKRLNAQYPELDVDTKIEEFEKQLAQENIDEQVKAFGEKLIAKINGTEFPDFDPIEREKAINGINRILKLIEDHPDIQEEQTKYRLKKVVALVWKAANDEALQRADGQNKIHSLIQEIYNLQVEYSQPGTIQDAASCPGGTINGLLNALNGLCSDKQTIVFIELIDQTGTSEVIVAQAKQFFAEERKRIEREDSEFMKKLLDEIQ